MSQGTFVEESPQGRYKRVRSRGIELILVGRASWIWFVQNSVCKCEWMAVRANKIDIERGIL